MEHRGKSWMLVSALAWLLPSALLPALAQAELSGEAGASPGFIAELFALLTFVLLALAAHWSARRRRD